MAQKYDNIKLSTAVIKSISELKKVKRSKTGEWEYEIGSKTFKFLYIYIDLSFVEFQNIDLVLNILINKLNYTAVGKFEVNVRCAYIKINPTDSFNMIYRENNDNDNRSGYNNIKVEDALIVKDCYVFIEYNKEIE